MMEYHYVGSQLSINGDSAQHAWLRLLYELAHHFEYKPAPRGFATRELLGVTLRVNDMRNNIIHHPVRNLNYRYLVAEWLWIALGLEDLGTLTQYNGQMSRFSDDGKVLAGAYGPRLQTQWQYVIAQLQQSRDSRQAVATIWTPNPSPSKDIPCTISLQFLVREDKLNLIVTMRSSDVWLGIPYDVYTFSQLGNSIAGILNLEPGFIQMQLGSSHLYEENLAKAEELLEDRWDRYEGIRSPLLPGFPTELLGKVLQDPKVTAESTWKPEPYGVSTQVSVLLSPWGKYAQVLRAPTWSEARRLLQED
jgi:thymidylate synthase